MSVFNRRLELLRILISRRKDKIENLATEFGVSYNTIRADIYELSLEFPIDTIQGYEGGVKVLDSFHPNKNRLTEEQEKVLKKLIVMLADEADKKILLEILQEFGSYKIFD